MRPSRFVPAGFLAALAWAGLAAGLSAGAPSAAFAQSVTVQHPQESLSLSVSKGTLVRLNQPASSVFIADPKIADVQVRSPHLIYVLGVGPGETSFYAMDDRDQVIYSASVHVSNNIDQIRSLLRAALPEASITVEPFNGMVMLSGQVPSPEAVGEAEHLVKQLLGEKQVVVNRLRAATPVQVNLQVKIAEVSRTLLKEVGFNLATRDATGGFLFGVWRGRSAVEITDKGYEFLVPEGTNTIGLAGKLFGLDAAAAIDALAEEGLVTILAEPNLTALSGEMASFLAGGEFAIPMPAENGRVLIEYKQYGVGLAFTPTVMSDNRITLRVRPEVSELSQAGAISVNGISVPGLTTRRAETTVELGSGQSFMIAGLLRNTTGQDLNKIPVLGDLPILGTLFRSDRFRRNETELVIIVTPYLVKPVNARDIRLPTDGYRAPSDLERWLVGANFSPTLERAPAPARPASPLPAPESAPAPEPASAPEALAEAVTETVTETAAPAPGLSEQGNAQ